MSQSHRKGSWPRPAAGRDRRRSIVGVWAGASLLPHRRERDEDGSNETVVGVTWLSVVDGMEVQRRGSITFPIKLPIVPTHALSSPIRPRATRARRRRNQLFRCNSRRRAEEIAVSLADSRRAPAESAARRRRPPSVGVDVATQHRRAPPTGNVNIRPNVPASSRFAPGWARDLAPRSAFRLDQPATTRRRRPFGRRRRRCRRMFDGPPTNARNSPARR